ncbi:hypothetical protein [Novosphingobium sp. CCH12-A3]|uniref:hypothetical protein n=1 Tax=Novosphingobium sp. CCH12-A3 TaxID=1768752 RepID=UPI001E38AE6F|nr:hypothetical protein [Novosphingobium sp. CCH12-A3]
MGRFSGIAMALAALATTALPVAAEAHGRWDRGGWGGRGWHRDRGGVDGGDVLAGLLIIGGIAAIATAASKAEKKRNSGEDDGYRYRPEDDQRDVQPDDWRDDSRAGVGSRGLNDAVDSCVTEAERKGEVDEVYDATRNGDGYRVSGTLRNGDSFSCDVSREGGVLLDIRRGRI